MLVDDKTLPSQLSFVFCENTHHRPEVKQQQCDEFNIILGDAFSILQLGCEFVAGTVAFLDK